MIEIQKKRKTQSVNEGININFLLEKILIPKCTLANELKRKLLHKK